MKAAVFDRHGPPEDVIRIQDIPTPQPGPGEVRVRMLASPVNPSDLQYVRGGYGLKPTFPAIPGLEGVGVVEAGGGLIGRFLRGKRVAVLNSRTGNWAEYTVAPARTCIPIPSDLSDEQAAAFFVNPATAIAITRHVLDVPEGEWLLQTAAGSALGKMVVRLGKAHGFRTVNVVRRREQVDELKQLGADAVLVESDGPLPEQVRKAVGGDGVRYAMDPVGGQVGAEVVQSLAAGGTAVLFGSLSGEPVPVDPRTLITGSKRVVGFWLADWAKGRGLLKKLKLIRQIRRLMRAGVLTTEVGETFPLARVTDAVRAATAPGKPGKVLIRMGNEGNAGPPSA